MKKKWMLMLMMGVVGGCGGATVDAGDDSEAFIVDGTEEVALDAKDDTPRTWTVQVGPGASMTFAPRSLTIKKGDRVKWVWAANNHTVTSGTPGNADGKFCSGVSTPSKAACAAGPLYNAGRTYTLRFTRAGTYPYFCRPHGAMGMTGRVRVTN